MTTILIIYHDLDTVIGISNILSHFPETTGSFPSLVLLLALPECSFSVSTPPPLTLNWFIHSDTALEPLFFPPSKMASPPVAFSVTSKGMTSTSVIFDHHPCAFLQPYIFHCLLYISTRVFHQYIKMPQNNFTLFLWNMASPLDFPISVDSTRTLVFILLSAFFFFISSSSSGTQFCWFLLCQSS